MANKKSLHNRFRIVIRRSPLLLKCALLVAIVVSVAALTVIRVGLVNANAQEEAARVQAAQLQRDNEKTEELIRQKDTVEGSKNIAKEVLDYVEPGTVIYNVITNQD